jgi:hypothetical protein
MFIHKNLLLINQIIIINSANMKNIYSILILFLLLFSISVFGQSKIYAPNLRAPENMEIDQVPDAMLDWDAVTGITLDITYEAQLATNPEFSDAVTFPRTDVTAQTMSSLLFGGTYYWHVRAFDDGNPSDWSETWSFTVSWTIEMDDPNDGATEFTNPVISWDPLTGVSSYQLQVDTSYAWNFDESGVTSDINATYIIDNSNMWIIGEDGLVLHDDGTGWANIEAGTTEDLNDLIFIDSSHGYAVGNSGVVLFYDGTAWTIVDVGTTDNLLGVSFVDSDNGVVVGDGGTVVIYSGGTWEIAATGDNNNLWDVAMINPSNIWACGEGKIVVNYDGSAWVANEVGTKDHYGIVMTDENNGWTVGKSGKIFRWDGAAWNEEESGTTKSLFSVNFEGMNGIAAGAKGTMLTFNGRWNEATALSEDDFFGAAISADGGLVVGENGMIIQKTGSGFDSPYLMDYNIPSSMTTKDLTNLFFGQLYFYRARAIHDADTSKWAGVKSFTVEASPELTSPSNSSETDLLVEFKWAVFEGITNYVFEVDIDENFGQPRSFSPDENILTVNDFVFGQEYFWRVAAQHAVEISDWSEVWSFNTVNMIILSEPENGAEDVISCPMFVWDEVLGASGYELWFDIDENFSNPMVIISDVPYSQCQNNLEKKTNYYWKVRGLSGPLLSDWSDTWSFKTEGYIGIDEQFNADAINIYPNPGNGEFNLQVISSTAGKYTVTVTSLTGKLVYDAEIKCKIGSNNLSIVLDNVSSGAYNLSLSKGNQVVTKQLVIK